MGFVNLDGFDEEAHWEAYKAKRRVVKEKYFEPRKYELYRLTNCGAYNTYKLMSTKGTIDEIQAEKRILKQKGYDGFIVSVHRTVLEIKEKP